MNLNGKQVIVNRINSALIMVSSQVPNFVWVVAFGGYTTKVCAATAREVGVMGEGERVVGTGWS